jgi:hypothetical protein
MQEGSQVRGCSSAWKMISAPEMKSGRLSVLAFEVGLLRRPTAAPKAPLSVPTVWMGTSSVGARGREEPRFVRGVGLPPREHPIAFRRVGAEKHLLCGS